MGTREENDSLSVRDRKGSKRKGRKGEWEGKQRGKPGWKQKGPRSGSISGGSVDAHNTVNGGKGMPRENTGRMSRLGPHKGALTSPALKGPPQLVAGGLPSQERHSSRLV